MLLPENNIIKFFYITLITLFISFLVRTNEFLTYIFIITMWYFYLHRSIKLNKQNGLQNIF